MARMMRVIWMDQTILTIVIVSVLGNIIVIELDRH
jgi:hypothetical protein